jgi:thioredoxin 1
MPVKVSIESFSQILSNNPGVVIFKFGATWCGPCKMLQPVIENAIPQMPNNVLFYDIDVDESIDLYAFLKSKKMINGIPALLAYYKGTLNYVMDDTIRGFDIQQANLFFDRCFKKANYMLVT